MNSDNENVSFNDDQYNQINIPNFNDMYKSEAQRLLKMINETMEFYYQKNKSTNVDAFNIYQVLSKIDKFESTIPGIDVLKNNLSNDISQMAQHLEQKVSENRKKRANEISILTKKIEELEKQKKRTIFKIIFFQWFLITSYFKTTKEINNLKQQIKTKEHEEYLERRAAFDEEQLVYISHRFREKYLNIPLPDSNQKPNF